MYPDIADAARELATPAALLRRLSSMSSKESLPYPGHPTEEQDHPHACLNGYIYLGYTALDEETGEEVERVEALPCRRCSEAAAGEGRS
jgi:hypothetical protein